MRFIKKLKTFFMILNRSYLFIVKGILQNKYFSWLQIITNWIMQGILHADKSERNYKVLFTFFTAILLFFCWLLIDNSIQIKDFIIFFVIAHSINWIFNCNFCVLFIHRMKWFEINNNSLFNHLFDIQKRLLNLKNKDWILYCVSHGGICNGTLNKYSDIDVSIIRKPGFKNLIYSILFYVKEKKIADLKGIPLDIFICDSPNNCISRSNYQKNPIVLLDHNNLVNNYYTDGMKITIKDAIKLNQ